MEWHGRRKTVCVVHRIIHARTMLYTEFDYATRAWLKSTTNRGELTLYSCTKRSELWGGRAFPSPQKYIREKPSRSHAEEILRSIVRRTCSVCQSAISSFFKPLHLAITFSKNEPIHARVASYETRRAACAKIASDPGGMGKSFFK